MSQRVAIVGAGMSGLVAARELQRHGLQTTVFEKARGPGGRMATRRAAGYAFDFGAQYFTARSGRMRRLVEGWLAEGVVAPWSPRLAEIHASGIRPSPDAERRYVGVPRMSALTRRLAGGLRVEAATRVTRLEPVDARWRLHGEARLGTFDAVLVSAPPEQTAALLGPVPELARQAASVVSRPCWAAMVAFPARLGTTFDAAFVHDAPLSWVARDASKPGRDRCETWVLHATATWSRAHLHSAPAEAATALLTAFRDVAGCAVPAPRHADAHRWALAQSTEPLGVGALWDPERRVGACGDWCGGTRVEAAVLSGLEAAQRVVATLCAPTPDTP